MRYTKLHFLVLAILLILPLCGSISNAQPDVAFEPEFGFFNGGRAYYLITDASNYNLATALESSGYVSDFFGINTTPKLRNAIAPGVNLPVLYYVTNNEQPLIFGTQWPSSTYMPIWKVIKVKWNIPLSQRTWLTSALDVGLARQSGKVTITTTDQVVAASILVNTAGAVIPQGQIGVFNQDLWIVLPTFQQYYNGSIVPALYLDFGYQSEASFYGANYAPAMNQLNAIRNQGLPEPWRKLYARFVNFPNQLPITPSYPGMTGYSPIENEWQLTARNVFPPSPITSVADIPGAWIKAPTNFMGYEPVLYDP